MAARDTGPIRFRFNGDGAQAYVGMARKQMGILKELMAFGNLPQLTRTVTLPDGATIHCQSIFGQDMIRIDAPVAAVEAGGEEEAAAAVNRVVDYVGVAMPNPVPYRGVSIGVVNRGAPTLSGSFTPTYNDGTTVVYTCAWTARNSAGVIIATGSGTSENSPSNYTGWKLTNSPVGPGIFTGGVPNGTVDHGWGFFSGMWVNGVYSGTGNTALYDSTLSSDIAAGTGGTWTYVMASDGQVLASELQNTISVASNSHYLLDIPTWTWSEVAGGYGTQSGLDSYPYSPVWSGGDNLYMFTSSSTPYLVAGGTSYSPGSSFKYKLKFTVPEDCIYGMSQVRPFVWSDQNAGNLSYYGLFSLGIPIGNYGSSAEFISDWESGATALSARRKAWFLKNSNEFMAALKGRFQPGAAGVTRAELQAGTLPASWDYQIKSQIQKNYNSFVLHDSSLAGRHTKMPIVMNITSAADVVVSDTSANLTQAGTKVTKRTTTFVYTDASGQTWRVSVDGILTQVAIQHTRNGSNVAISWQDTYTNWYDMSGVSDQTLLPNQFLRDRTADNLGLLWNGVIQQGRYATSTYGAPSNPLTYAGYAPAYPVYSNTLAGTAPDIFLQYHNTVLPQYVADTAQSSTAMNNSAMYHVKQVELCLFGPAPGGQAVGIFPDPTDADGATQIAYYGEASFSFDWTQGKLTMLNWAARKDANGNDAPTIIAMPSGYSYKNVSGTLYFNDGVSNYTQAYNCAIGYAWDSPDQMWPDVAEYLRAKIAQMLAGGGDQVLYTIIKQALAL